MPTKHKNKKGNSEAHLDDLCAQDFVLRSAVESALRNTIYPLVRSAFSSEGGDTIPVPDGPLCVYDSIFVRYNGDVARAKGKVGASQPLVSF